MNSLDSKSGFVYMKQRTLVPRVFLFTSSFVSSNVQGPGQWIRNKCRDNPKEITTNRRTRVEEKNTVVVRRLDYSRLYTPTLLIPS